MNDIKMGKEILLIIVSLRVVLDALLGGGTALFFVLDVVLAICLYTGIKWVKWLFIIITAIRILASLLVLIAVQFTSVIATFYYLIFVIYGIFSIVMLLKSKHIKAYFEFKQRKAVLK